MDIHSASSDRVVLIKKLENAAIANALQIEVKLSHWRGSGGLKLQCIRSCQEF